VDAVAGNVAKKLEVAPGRVGLGRGAMALRIAHAALAVVELAGLGYLWACAVNGRRDRLLTASVGLLVAEGAALVVGRGDCPLGPLQERCGDPTPLFELILPSRLAKAAVPVLAAVAASGVVTLIARHPAGAGRVLVTSRRAGPTGRGGRVSASPG
jgi:hypothetical protein